MEVKPKQHWSEEETQCFLTLWASSEVQNMLEGASRTKPVFEQIQRDMAVAGYGRTLNQLLNKLKKLKKEYREQRKQLERNGQMKRTPHFDLLDSVLGDRPVPTALNPATATTDLRLLILDEFVVRSGANDTKMLPMDKEAESKLLPPLSCSSPSPSCTTSSTSSSTHQTKSAGKRKRDSTTELIEYLERSEKRFMEQTRRDQDLTRALLQNVHRMDETAKTLVGLMERMVSVMERSSQK